ncbi:hypothetical protein ACHAWF_013928 [Thalassiosira exigua]
MESNDDHVQPLLDDDQPSWVTLANEGEGDGSAVGGRTGNSRGSSPWDQAAARLNLNASARGSTGAAPLGNRDQRQKNEDDLPKIVLLMRLGNIGAAALLIFGSVGSLTNILSLSKMVLGGYGVCFGVLVCCLEANFSFLRQWIASNFGFLYNPFLRLAFYILMGMVAWSFNTLLGMIASGALCLLALVNTYVICRYPGYRAVLKEISDEEEKMMRREGRKQAWKHATSFSLPWWEV